MEQFQDGLGDAWASMATFLPKLIGFLLILVIGYFIAKAISKIVGKVLERVGFDKAVERGGVGQALEKSKYDASDILGKVVFYALFRGRPVEWVRRRGLSLQKEVQPVTSLKVETGELKGRLAVAPT